MTLSSVLAQAWAKAKPALCVWAAVSTCFLIGAGITLMIQADRDRIQERRTERHYDGIAFCGDAQGVALYDSLGWYSGCEVAP